MSIFYLSLHNRVTFPLMSLMYLYVSLVPSSMRAHCTNCNFPLSNNWRMRCSQPEAFFGGVDIYFAASKSIRLTDRLVSPSIEHG